MRLKNYNRYFQILFVVPFAMSGSQFVLVQHYVMYDQAIYEISFFCSLVMQSSQSQGLGSPPLKASRRQSHDSGSVSEGKGYVATEKHRTFCPACFSTTTKVLKRSFYPVLPPLELRF